MSTQTLISWLDFVYASRNRPVDGELMKATGLEQSLQFSGSLEFIFQHSIPCLYLLDYTSSHYIFMSENTASNLGFSREHFMQGGLDFVMEHYHPDDFRLYNEQIFPDRMAFLSSIPPDEHKNYMFSYNFRFRARNQQYRSLLQRNCYIQSDAHGRPLLSMGMVFNVDHFKNPNTSIQLIERMSLDTPGKEAELLFKKTYFTGEEALLLTKRELELLRLLALGLSSKLIADKLYISAHTVTAHRKKMLTKTKANNVAEMIAWAKRLEII